MRTITKAALAAGFKVIATGRNTDKVAKALGKAENLAAQREVLRPHPTLTVRTK